MSDAPLYRPPEAQGDLALRVVAMPGDLNPQGDVFGGWILAQVDLAAGVAGWRLARGRVATVAVNSVQFKQPVAMGDVVSLYTRVLKTGHTSITVGVEVYAERSYADPAGAGSITVKVTEAVLTLVAIDAKGQKRPLPQAGLG